MKKLLTFSLATSLVLFTAGCSESDTDSATHTHADGTVHNDSDHDADTAAKNTAAKDTAAKDTVKKDTAEKNSEHADHVHDLKCGCVIEGVDKCGEYISVNDKFIPLTLPESTKLGSMPFCHKDGLRAKVEGSVTDGKFVATSFAYVEKKEK